LDGNQPDRLCAPIVAHVEARGGVVKTGCPVKEIELDEATGEVARLHLASGEKVRVT
jgi:15-cis-phytoene desaturase